jgi:hypothetical protein
MTTMVMDFDNKDNENDEGGDDASLTTSNKGNNRNQDDGKDAYALLAATLPALW